MTTATTRQPCSIVEAAEMLGVKPPTIRAWIAQRRIPYYRMGRRIILDRNELVEFREACRVEPIEIAD